MALPRSSIPDFEVANAAYSLSEVTVFIANADGSKGALATLYSSLTGLGTLPNPQTLDNTGKWQQPVYIDNDIILQINSPLDPLLDHDTGIVRFGGRWRGVWTGPGTHYNIDDRILGPVGTAEESNVYKSLSIWDSAGTWAADLADATLMQLELDYQALRTLALAALPDASETVKGKIELATQAETNAGTDDVRAVTPKKLVTMQATETQKGVAEIATQTEVNTGANDTTIVSPSKLKAMAASETLTGIAALATQAEVNAAGNDTDIVTPQKLWTTPMRGGWRNIVGANGGGEVWQRGAGGTASIAVAASTIAYTADRWYLSTGANQACTVSQQAGLANGSRFCIRAQRNAGQTGITGMLLGYPLDLDEARRLLSSKASVRLRLRLGADFSGTLALVMATGTGAAPGKVPGGGLTGRVDIISTSVHGLATPGGAAVDVHIAGSIVGGSGISQGDLFFFWTPSGTAGADDWFEIDDVDLRADEPLIDQFERHPFDDELRACQRHFQKSFQYITAPAQNAGTNSALLWRAHVAGAVGVDGPMVRLAVPMRVNPTGVTYNPAAANAQVRNTTDGADLSATSILALATATQISATQTAGTAVNEILACHYTLDAGI